MALPGRVGNGMWCSHSRKKYLLSWKKNYRWEKTSVSKCRTAEDTTGLPTNITEHERKFRVAGTLKFKILFSKGYHQ